MAKRGRIPKFTTELATRFCGHVANGVSRNRAAALVGVDPATVYRWLAQSRRGDGGRIFASFASDVARAEAEFIAERVSTVVRASRPKKVRMTKTVTRADGSISTEVTEKVESDWAAAKWLLECKDRETFGPDRHEIAALRKELAELRMLLATRVGTVGGQASVPTTSSGQMAPTA